MQSETNGHGPRNEDIVETLCHCLLGRDFVLRSPQLIEKSGTKELTDFLILVDDTAIVMQSKSLAVDISTLDQIKFGRIRKKHEEAKRQLNTTLNAHARGAHVRAKNPLNVTFDIDWSWIKKKVGIVTLHVVDELYSDPEFRFQYPHLVEEYRGIIVHTFLVNDLVQMTSEFSTAADMLLYLEMRRACVMSGKFMIMNELDFLAMYKTRFPEIQRALSGPLDFIGIEPGVWEEYRSDLVKRIQERDERFRNGEIIDELIRRLHTSVEYTAIRYGITPDISAANYFRLIGKLGKLIRMERAWIGDKLIEKLERTRTKGWGYFIHISPHTNTAYFFLLANEPDRNKRTDLLQYFCVQVCHEVNCAEVVGVVSEGAQLGGSSIDALVMNVSEVRSVTQPEKEFKLFKAAAHQTVTEWSS